MSLFKNLIQKGELPEVRTVLEFDVKSSIELGIIILITAICILLASKVINKFA